MITGKKKATFFIVEGYYDKSTHQLLENRLKKVWVKGYTKSYDGIVLGFHKSGKTQCWTVTDVKSGMRILNESTLDNCEIEILKKLEDIKKAFSTNIRRQKIIEQIKNETIEEVKLPEESKTAPSGSKKKATFFILEKWGDLSSRIEVNGYIKKYNGINIGFYNSHTGKEKWKIIDTESGLLLFRVPTLSEGEEKILTMMDKIEDFIQNCETRKNVIEQLNKK